MAKGQKGALKSKVKGLALTAKGMWKTPLKGRYLTLKEMCYFGAFALGNSWLMNAVNYVTTVAFIPYFYRIDTIHAYVIVTIATFVNMLILPIIGNKIERTRTKIGRYKPFILGCIPIYAIFGILAMSIPQINNEGGRILYAYLTCAPSLVISTFCNNMYQNMPTVITPNTQERADIMTPIGLVVGFAPTVLQIVVGPIRAAFGEAEYLAMRIIGMISVFVSIACMLFILKVQERVYDIKTDDKGEEKVTLKEAFKMLAKNKPLIIFCIALVLGSLRDFTGQFRWLIIQFRFNADVEVAKQISGVPQTIIGFAATVSMLLLPIVTRKMDKKWIAVLFTVTSTLPNLILAIVRYENIPVGTPSLIGLTLLFFISCINPMYLLIPIMLGELADYQQYKTGKRLDGHLQNLLFVLPALATNVLMLCSYYLQKMVGFEAKDYADITHTLNAAEQMVACEWFDIVALISAVSGILLAIVMLFYPLSRKKHKEVMESLSARGVLTNVDNAENADTANATDEVAENVAEDSTVANEVTGVADTDTAESADIADNETTAEVHTDTPEITETEETSEENTDNEDAEVTDEVENTDNEDTEVTDEVENTDKE